MKIKAATIAQALSVAAAIAIVATVAFAYTNPTGSAPTGNVPAPVNTGTAMQTKQGDLGLGGAGTGNLFAAMNVWSRGVYSNNAYFGPGATTANQTFLTGLQSVSGIFEAVNSTGQGVRVDNNGNLAITTGNPAAGYVLTSDANGNATWQPGGASAVTTSTINTSGAGGLVKYVFANGLMSGTNGGNLTATCPSGYFVIGGGGDCNDNAITDSVVNDSYGNNDADQTPSSLQTSPTNSNGWFVACNSSRAGQDHIHAFAVCMENTTLSSTTISIAPPVNTATTTTTTTTRSWHNVTYAAGSSGQSCTTWLGLNGFSTNATGGPGGTPNVRTFVGGSGSAGPGNGDCAYEGNPGGTPYGYSEPDSTVNSGLAPTSFGTGGPQTQIYY